MPRVNNAVSAVADRLLSAVMAISTESVKYRQTQETLKKLSDEPSNPVYVMASDYLKKIETDRLSLATTILGIHEKFVSRDWSNFIDWCIEFAETMSDSAPAETIEKFNKFIAEQK